MLEIIRDFGYVFVSTLKKGQKSPILKAIIMQYTIITYFFALSRGFKKIFPFLFSAYFRFATLLYIELKITSTKTKNGHLPVFAIYPS